MVGCLGFKAYQPLRVIQRQIHFYTNNQFYFKKSPVKKKRKKDLFKIQFYTNPSFLRIKKNIFFRFLFNRLTYKKFVSKIFSKVDCVRQWSGRPGSIRDRVIPKTEKKGTWCRLLSTTKWGSRVKWSNPGYGVALSLRLQCSSYWKWEPSGYPQLR